MSEPKAKQSSSIQSKSWAMNVIDRQVQKKLVMKKGVRKKLKQSVEKLIRNTSLLIFNKSAIPLKPYDGVSVLGADEHGRDIADGLFRYRELLKSRGVRLHTLIVLGSRVKGGWKPSSDVDVTVIASNLPKLREGFSVKKLLGMGSASLLSDKPLLLGIEPSGCSSRQEFLRRIEELNVEALDALYYGLVLYDDGFWQEAKLKLRQVEQLYNLNEAEMKDKLRYI